MREVYNLLSMIALVFFGYYAENDDNVQFVKLYKR